MGCGASVYQKLDGKVFHGRVKSIKGGYVYAEIDHPSSPTKLLKQILKAKLYGVELDDNDINFNGSFKKLVFALTNRIVFGKIDEESLSDLLELSSKIEIQVVHAEEGVMYVNLFKNKELINIEL